jgi:hypothetical protein
VNELEPVTKRRSAAERFAHLGDRLGRALPNVVRAEGPGEPIEEPDYPLDDEQETAWYEIVPRFPIARSGYDCAAVDEHVTALEQELAEMDRELADLRARTPAHEEVQEEIHKLGEQTSAILLAAHDRAREMTQAAQEQADRCLSDAAASALSTTQEAGRRREEIVKDIERLSAERSRLLADIENLSNRIAAVAREGQARTFSGTPKSA